MTTPGSGPTDGQPDTPDNSTPDAAGATGAAGVTGPDTGNGRWAQYRAYPGAQDSRQDSHRAGGQSGYGAYPGAAAPQPAAGRDSFWGALFDFGFTTYATPAIIKVAYGLGFAFVALVWVAYLFFVFFGLAGELGPAGALLGLLVAVVVTVGALFSLMMMRMMLEFYLSNIRIAQSAQRLEQQAAYRR